MGGVGKWVPKSPPPQQQQPIFLPALLLACGEGMDLALIFMHCKRQRVLQFGLWRSGASEPSGSGRRTAPQEPEIGG